MNEIYIESFASLSLSNFFYMFEPTWLHIINNGGSLWVLLATCFILIIFHFAFCIIASTRNENKI